MMERRWGTRLAGTGVGAAGAVAAIVIVASSIDSDTVLGGFEILSALFVYGPVALGVGALVVGSGEEAHPTLAGMASAHIAWALAFVVSSVAIPEANNDFQPFLSRLLVGQVIPTVPMLGALGGFLGGRLRRLRS